MMVKGNITDDPSKSIPFLEWKECRSTIARFDDSVLNLRKYGFSLITLLIGTQGVIYASLLSDNKYDCGVVIGIYLTIMLLIFGLFRLDRMFHIFLRGAVNRAKNIESEVQNLNLSIEISEVTKRSKTARWGASFYILFCIANYVLVSGSLLNFSTTQNFKASFEKNGFVFLICSVIAVMSIVAIIYFHTRSAKAAYSD